MMRLKASEISIGYGSKPNAMPLLKNFQLDLAPGEVLAVIGANGSGKSSLLRVLSGLQVPLSGKVEWMERSLDDIPSSERPRMTSVLFREFARVDGFTVADLVALGRQPYTGFLGRLRETDKMAVTEAMVKTGMNHLSHKQLHTLSDGELQKAMLAKMIAQDAPLMILDEPTTHLDLPSAIDFIKLLKSSAQEARKTVVFSTHDLALVFKLADRILLLDGKGSWALGSPEEIAGHALMCGFLRTDAARIVDGNLIIDFPQK